MLLSVALATHNGGRFLTEQLDSIYAQNDIDTLEVVASDDASTDDTLRILERYTSRGLRYTRNNPPLRTVKNFEKALTLCSGQYLALADQDDYWFPHKLSHSLKKLRTLENHYGAHTPLLVFTDLKVVDEQLKPIHASYREWMGFTHTEPEFSRLLVENIGTGCTFVFNRALLELALPFPAEGLLHDRWLLWVAACFGRAEYLNEVTIAYRQHGGNQVGARQLTLLQEITYTGKVAVQKNRLLANHYPRVRLFLNRYQDQLNHYPTQLNIIHEFLKLEHDSFFQRITRILRNGFWGQSFWGNVRIVLKG
ncbi:MAG: glycosyltransferase family 2 protein [Siphonobacter sp.]